MTLDGYIVKEKKDDGKIFYYSSKPSFADGDFYCGNCGDVCFNIDLPIKEFLSADNPQRCRIKIELEK